VSEFAPLRVRHLPSPDLANTQIETELRLRYVGREHEQGMSAFGAIAKAADDWLKACDFGSSIQSEHWQRKLAGSPD